MVDTGLYGVLAMMAGHAFLAFTVVAIAAYVLGRDADQAVYLGVAAAVFAVLPDVDMLYAATELTTLLTTGVSGFIEAFWSASSDVHRGISHSIVIGILAAIGFTWYYTDARKSVAVIVVTAFTLYGVYIGPISAAVAFAFTVLGLGITDVIRNRIGISAAEFFSASLVGLVSHPFGDVFTGTPPLFFGPIDIQIITERVVLHADATLNLLSIFLLELLLAGAGLIIYMYLTDRDIRYYIHPAAALGSLYTATIIVLPPPTLAVSYHFVYTLLGLGILCGTYAVWKPRNTITILKRRTPPSLPRPTDIETENTLHALVTGWATVSIGFIGYTAAYLLWLL